MLFDHDRMIFSILGQTSDLEKREFTLQIPFRLYASITSDGIDWRISYNKHHAPAAGRI
jgi:hypothetical protein